MPKSFMIKKVRERFREQRSSRVIFRPNHEDKLGNFIENVLHFLHFLKIAL